jgi:two-component system, cell cycle sensor histidine kinase and response regulator CckA
MCLRNSKNRLPSAANDQTEQPGHKHDELSSISIRQSLAEAMYAKAFAINPAAIGIVRFDNGQIIDVNKSWEDMFRYSREEAVGKMAVNLHLWPESEDRNQFIADLTERGSLRDREYKVLRKSGDSFVALCSAELMTLAGEKYIVSTWLDITERTHASQALQQSEQNYREIFNNVSDAICIHDAETGAILDVNNSLLQMFGVDQQETKTLTPNEAGLGVSPYSEAEAKQWLRKALTEGPQVFEWQSRRKDGMLFWVEVALRGAEINGQKRVLALVRNITDRKQAENALSRSQKNLAEAQRQTHIGSFEFDFQTERLDWSEEMFRICGVLRENFRGAMQDFLERVHPEDLAYVERIREQGRMHAGPLDLSFRIMRPNGELRFVRMIFETTFKEDGSPLTRIGTFQDITETTKAEEEKKKLESQLQQAQKMESIGRLAGGVAHDFNNMLSVILGHVELALQEVASSQPLHGNLKEIQNAAKRSADLTRQLLAFARKQTVHPRVLDLNETVSGMARMLQRLIGENIIMEWKPGADIWPVKMDPSQIDQILANLAVNARDAVEGMGALTIETVNATLDEVYCSAHAGCVPGDYVLLAVSDTGIGMDEKTLAHIFEPFFTTKEVGKGTGLGLATIYGIVKQNKGYIDVRSQPGHGTRFEIYLPCDISNAIGIPVISLEPIQFGQETILLVEDEPAILKLTTRILKRQGYTVLAASTPSQAIRLAKEHQGDIQILITDVAMPEMTGCDLAENLLSLYPQLKCLFMSGYTADVIAQEGVLGHNNCFLRKPFTIKELGDRLERVKRLA